MYEFFNDAVFFNLCCDIFENERMISNHGVMLFCFFLNNVQYMFYNASAFNQNLCSWSFPSYDSSRISYMFNGTSCQYKNVPPAYACDACV